MIYLASPYSHPDPAVRQRRFDQVCQVASILMRHGTLVFSPIAHSHPIALAGGLPTDFAFWSSWNRAHLSACESLIVLQLDGWDASVGVRAEIQIARELSKPVGYLEYRTEDPKGLGATVTVLDIIHPHPATDDDSR